jgi:hypothetical protein
MRGLLLLLSLVGAAIYGLLVVTHNAMPNGKADDTFAGQTQPNHPVDRDLRSWGSNLPALVISQQPSRRHPPAYGPRPHNENPGQYSERTSGADDQPAVAEDKLTASRLDGAKQEHTEWAKVVLAARVHSEASVSSPTIRFYRPGTELQVVRREKGWLQVSDPATQERGWIFENYLSSFDGRRPTQAAMDSPTEDGLSEPTPTKAILPS